MVFIWRSLFDLIKEVIKEWPLFTGWTLFGGGLLHRFDSSQIQLSIMQVV